MGESSPLMTTLRRKVRVDSSAHSPTSSPMLGYQPVGSKPHISQGHGRARNVSFVNPCPLLKIVLDGLSSKVIMIIVPLITL